jgi:hypothetical protein
MRCEYSFSFRASVSQNCLNHFFSSLRRGKPRLYTKWGLTTIYNRKIRLRVLIRL